MWQYFACYIHRRRKLPYTLRSPKLHIFVKAVWRAAIARGRTEGANAWPKWLGVNLSGTEEWGSGTAWTMRICYFLYSYLCMIHVGYSFKRLL